MIELKKFLKKLIFRNKVPKNYLKINILKYENLDSVSIFKMIVKIESKYKIKFTDKEIFSNKFSNINNIYNLIKKKKNEIKKK
tara:strand:- start:108 stop:356 length:249 start_codon:yes stop_codon:yes gene_type:complete